MEQLKELFGEEKLSFDEFMEKITNANIKLADLSGGRYVDKGKYDGLAEKYEKIKAEYDGYKVENDGSKYADYDALKNENAELKAQADSRAKIDAVRQAGVDEKFADYVATKVSEQVTAEKDFETALAEYLDANKQFMQTTSEKTVYNGSDFNKATPTEKASLSEFLTEHFN